ncbi:hypothetical protein NDU88_000717 [Pleurodeles waltl]|uniref:Uncharacterized protein n=1 Tax=Pleurodeles waltl TaxID=8319 RepID=A0AAV7NGW5_PLEWA|nr:hypothetical protein NDU88_000717 [Pleurodeles waltl]
MPIISIPGPEVLLPGIFLWRPALQLGRPSVIFRGRSDRGLEALLSADMPHDIMSVTAKPKAIGHRNENTYAVPRASCSKAKTLNIMDPT